MFVDDRDAVFASEFPAVIEVFAIGKRAGSADDGDLGVFRFHRVVDHLETFAEDRRDLVLIADAEVFQTERCRMAGSGAAGAPSRRGWSVRPLNEIENFLNVAVQFTERQSGLTDAMARILTTHTGSDDRERLRADVLAELKIFEVAEPDGLMIAPEI